MVNNAPIVDISELENQECGAWPRYLVFAENVRWDGASGYKFAKTIRDAFSRDYDASFYLQNSDKKKVVRVTECHHDRPTGATTHIIGLSEDEFDALSDASFDEVCSFVQERRCQ